MPRVLISGGFDPIHIGHIRYIREASKFGDVIVALNSDDWLKRKKGFVFMPFEERREILLSINGVSDVYQVDDSDDTVCEAIESLAPEYFAKGGDRKYSNTPEVVLCESLGVRLLWDVGGGKIQASSDIVNRNWGFYRVLHEEDFKVKILTVLPYRSTSLQRHSKRNEHWVFPGNNEYKFIPVGEVHQLRNDSDKPIQVVEIQTGKYFGEDDIERFT